MTTPQNPRSPSVKDTGAPPGLDEAVPRLLKKVSRFSPGLAAELAWWAFFWAPRGMKVHPRQADVMARGQRSVVRSQGYKLVMWSWGHGPRALLVHGWGGRASQMTPLVDPLLLLGYQVVAIDGPAHGESSHRRSSVANFADVVLDLGARDGGYVAAVTHSLGGPAVALALTRGLALQKAVFISPPVDLENFWHLFLKNIRVGPKHEGRLLERAARSFGVQRGELAMASTLTKAPVPFLVVHDEHDDKADFKLTESLLQQTSTGTLFRTQGLGHNRILRDPEVLATVARFVGPAPR